MQYQEASDAENSNGSQNSHIREKEVKRLSTDLLFLREKESKGERENLNRAEGEMGKKS